MSILLEKLGKSWKCSWEGEDLIFDQQSSSRLIFFDENYQYVIKIDATPKVNFQHKQTAREIDFWESLTEDFEYFAEVQDYGKTKQGFYWLKQKWYVQDEDCIATSNHLQTLNDLIFKYKLRDVHPEWTDGSGNWMISKGEVLIFDWGLTKT